MPATLFGERFMGRREPAWHGLGQVFDESLVMSPLEAIVRAGCDYEVQKLPLTVKLPDGTSRRTDQVAIVRYPTHDQGSYHVMGYASSNYEVVQNIELGVMLEDLAKDWPVETVGALGEGEQVFITLFAGEDEVVKGDSREAIRHYLLMSNAHDGKRSLRIALTPVRVVCQNTLIAATSAAVVTTTIPHRTDVRDETGFRLKLIASVRKQQATMMEEFRKLAQTRVVESQVREILEAAYPDPKPWRKQLVANVVVNDEALMAAVNDNKAVAARMLSDLKRYGSEYEQRLEKQRNLRDFAAERFQLVNEESPAIAGTAYAVWQGVTETESYRGKAGKSSSESILFGERGANMSRAYAKAMEMVEA